VPGVFADAGKATKQEAQYGPGTGRAHCAICRYYMVVTAQLELGRCTRVKGGIRPEDWCKYFAGGGSTHKVPRIDRNPPKSVGAKDSDR
jgi:hypothetical protein